LFARVFIGLPCPKKIAGSVVFTGWSFSTRSIDEAAAGIAAHCCNAGGIIAANKDLPRYERSQMPDSPETRAAPPRYAGPKALAQALTQFALHDARDAAFTRDGPRADVEYRDLGWAEATAGAIGAKHIRAIRPFDAETGWHWHDMTGHFVYVLRGWIKFRYDGVDGEVTVNAGSSLSQPAGVPHNVVGRSDDLELIEINLPAVFGTWDLPGMAQGPA
jgi:mannose-6-phosphate isomerase-like protein (cupin superfamily)